MEQDWFNDNIKDLLNVKTKSRSEFSFPDLQMIYKSNLFWPIPYMDSTFICKGGTFSGLVTVVPYEQGKIVYFPKQNSTIGISFLFTGCYMAQFKYYRTEYIAHISTGLNYDCKSDWNNFVYNCMDDNRFSDFFLYKPFDDLAADIVGRSYVGGSRTLDVCGIIDTSGNWYTGLIRYSDFELIELHTSSIIKRIYGSVNVNNVNSLHLP